ATADVETDLRQLCGLARACLTADDDNLAGLDRARDFVALAADRQLLGIGDPRNARPAPRDRGAGRLDLGGERLQGLRLARLPQPALQTETVAEQAFLEVLREHLGPGHGGCACRLGWMHRLVGRQLRREQARAEREF